MKFLDEYRDGDLAQRLAAEIHHYRRREATGLVEAK